MIQQRIQSGTILLTVVCTMALGAAAAPANDRCNRCAAKQSEKVCRLVCVKKVVEVPCYSSKYETFCVGGPCRKACKQCEAACTDGKGTCSHKGGCSSCASCQTGLLKGNRFAYQETIPSCPKQFTKKILLRKMVKKEVTVYKWVLEDLCAECESKTPQPVVPKSAHIPAPPKTDAVILAPRRVEVAAKPVKAKTVKASVR